MKLKFTPKAIQSVVRRLSAAVYTGHTLEVLTHFLVQVDGQRARITASNMSTELSGMVDVQAERDGQFTLPAKRFASLLGMLPAEADITLSIEGERITLRCGRSRYELAGLPADAFPVRKTESGKSLELDCAMLRRSLEYVAPAMAVKDIRSYINGAYLEIEGGKLHVVATDGHRMAHIENEVNFDHADGIILPSEAALLLINLLGEYSGEVALTLSSQAARLGIGDYMLSLSLLDGRYPDWRRVMPKDFEVIEVDASAMRDALKRAALFTSEKYAGVAVNVSHDAVQFTATNASQESATELVDTASKFKHESGVNCAYLLDALETIDTARASIGIVRPGDNTSQIVMRPAESTDRMTIVMPMRI